MLLGFTIRFYGDLWLPTNTNHECLPPCNCAVADRFAAHGYGWSYGSPYPQRPIPLRPDRNHLHHILLHAGFAPRESLFIMVLLGSVMMSIGVLSEHFQVHETSMMVLFWGCLFFILLASSMHGGWGDGQKAACSSQNNYAESVGSE